MEERVTKTEPKTKTTVLEVDELQNLLGIKGWLGRRIAWAVYRLLEFKEVNRIHHKFHDSFGPEFSAHVLEEVGVRYEIPPEQLERIPKDGGFITVSNHHYGSLDGMILSSVVGSRRPDYKILTTFFLSMIPSLKDSFIPVDNFSSGGARSISGIRAALGHIGDQHPLGLFPAGEVATWQKGNNKTSLRAGKVVEDIPWAENIVKLVLHIIGDVPVRPDLIHAPASVDHEDIAGHLLHGAFRPDVESVSLSVEIRQLAY